MAPLVAAFSVLGPIYLGITTATEAAAIGVFVAFIICLIRKGFVWHKMGEALGQTVLTTSFILFIIIGAQFFSWVLNYLVIPQHILNYMITLPVSPMQLIIIFMVVYFILGMFLDTLAQIFITMPIILPILNSLGFDPIWFGILFFIVVEIGLVSPPYGMLLYVVKSIAPPDVTFGDIIRGYARAFVWADLTVLILIFTIPQIAMWLPNMMFAS